MGTLTTVQVTGALLPPDVLSAILASTLDGLTTGDYHLGGESPREAAARVWTHLLGAYRRFRDELARLPDQDPAVGVTRERWLTVLLTELGYGRVPATGPGGLTVADTAYPVSHLWQSVPIHLLGWGVPLDKRTPGVPGAAHRAPHAMVQELLNRSDSHLWALLANGRALRLLRDSTTLTGQAYVEFDLEAMFDGEVFSEFALLFLLAHQSRLEIPDGGGPADCWLERWRTTAVSQGVRALSLLRDGVQNALQTLGTGFLQHPANSDLRTALADKTVTVGDLHQALLRTVYRLLFWAVAEDRQALLDRDADAVAADRYDAYFSNDRLRRLARTRHGSAHDDLWQGVALVFDALGRDGGEPRLALPGLGGLFAATEADVLLGARLGNRPLLAAVRALTIVQPPGQPQRLVDFRHLGAEELGSVYESLLELVPRHDPTTHQFSLETSAGNDRKTTGSYYTPTDLVELVLDTALEPLLDDAVKKPDPESALLAITCCDPAVGSGHFVVSAARRIATRLAAVRTGEVDPTPTTIADAMHDVVARCVYGVDLNPMAADLAKVSLWLEAMSPGRPLSFLDHHIKVGNALLGTTPALLAAGIPDAAYTALTGDDKFTAAAWRKENANEKAGQFTLFDRAALPVGNESGRGLVAEIAARAAGNSLADISWAAQRYRAGHDSVEQRRVRRVADAWCAAFLSPKAPDTPAITAATLEAIAAGTAPPDVEAHVDAVAARHRLFHWHLEFPEIFPTPEDGVANTATGWTGGFASTLGNPPWERIKLQEQEFFASREPAIAQAKNADARKKAIARLADTNPALLAEFETAKRVSEAESQFLRTSGRFPFCGVGDVNTYTVFAEHFRSTIDHHGRMGIITPTGLATDATTAAFFADSLRGRRVAAFIDFENRAPLFAGVDRRFRFAITSLTGGVPVDHTMLAFLNSRVAHVAHHMFPLDPDDVLLLNPNTGTLPVFGSTRDADLTLGAYRRFPILVREGDGEANPWGLQFMTMFHITNDAGLFNTAEDLLGHGAVDEGWSWTRGDEHWLPLYGGMQLGFFDHRVADIRKSSTAAMRQQQPVEISTDEKMDPQREARSLYWVSSREVDRTLTGKWDRDWLMGWREITSPTNARTFLPVVFPRSAVGNSVPLALANPDLPVPGLLGIWSSLVFDYIARQKVTRTSLNQFLVRQFACPTPRDLEASPPWATPLHLSDWLADRVLELIYTSWKMEGFARDFGRHGPPFVWNDDRRIALMAEVDAAAFHMYELDRPATMHVLDSFETLARIEDRDHGEFRTKRLVLAAYDAMSEAALTGEPFVSPLDPPPGYAPRHPERA